LGDLTVVAASAKIYFISRIKPAQSTHSRWYLIWIM